MTPIVSPWIFYLFHVLSALSDLAVVVLICAVVACVFMGIPLIDDDLFVEEPTLAKLRKYFKRSFICIIISAIALTLIPSEDTLYKMFISSYVTEDNIKMVGDTAEDLVDYIVDKAKELKEDD